MPKLNCVVATGLLELLENQAARTKETIDCIVSIALADYFGVQHHTLYQVSTSNALVEGVYQVAVRVGESQKTR